MSKHKNKSSSVHSGVFSANLKALKMVVRLTPGVLFSSVSSSLFSACSPYVTLWFSARIIQELSANRDPEVLLHLVLWLLAATALTSFITALLTRWHEYENEISALNSKKIFMKKMSSVDYLDIESAKAIDMYQQIAQNTMWSGYGVSITIKYFTEALNSLFRILGGVGLSVTLFLKAVPEDAGALVFLNSPFMSVIIPAVLLGSAILSSFLMGRSEKTWSDYAAGARLSNRVFGFFGFLVLENQRAVDQRIYKQQENLCNPYLEGCNGFGVASLIAKKARGSMGILGAAADGILVIATLVIYLFVCLKAYGGAFGIGDVTQYIGAVTGVFGGVVALMKTAERLGINADFLKNTFDFLALPEKMHKGNRSTEEGIVNEIRFENVSFRYPGAEDYALRNISFSIVAGKKTAIVGVNGSGKTTFIKLLARLYDPTEGRILLNGTDIKDYDYEEYMKMFAVVFQDFSLFALPLGENVAGSCSYDKTEVKECLREVGLDLSKQRSLKSLDTCLYKELDNNGVSVSGGEAQKIAIARSLYKKASILVLDEPTAALDPIAEAEIYSKFDEIAKNRTAIYISHRLSSCKFCDEIAVFSKGRIIQHGSHERLLSDVRGEYFKLWNAQAQYYTDKN